MENTPFIGDFPIETSIYRGLSIAMFDYQRVPQISTAASDYLGLNTQLPGKSQVSWTPHVQLARVKPWVVILEVVPQSR